MGGAERRPGERPEQGLGRADVQALTDAAADLTEVVKAAITREVASLTVPRAELLRRLRLGLVVAVVVSITLVVGARVNSDLTRDRTLRQLNANISRCLVRPGALSPADARYCARPEVFGKLFAQTQAQSAAAIAANRERERRVDRLEAEVRQLQTTR